MNQRIVRITVCLALTLLIGLAGSPVGAARLAGSQTATAWNEGPQVWVSPLLIDFGPVPVGSTSLPQMVTVHSYGSENLTGFTGGSPDAPFVSLSNCPESLEPGKTCTYSFQFSPIMTGPYSSVATVYTNAGPFIVEMRGTGVGAQAHVRATVIDFGPVLMGDSTSSQSVKIHNTGVSVLNAFTGGEVEAPFGMVHNCAAGVPPGGYCSVTYTFDPGEEDVGEVVETSQITSSGGSFEIELRGWGTASPLVGPVLWATPLEVDFGPVGLGIAKSIQVTLTNSGNQEVTDFSGGGVSVPFGASHNCPEVLGPGSSCVYTFTFTPAAEGTVSGQSNIVTSGGSPSIRLRGTGVGAKVWATPLKLNFGQLRTGLSSPLQAVTIKNVGKAPLRNFSGGGVSAPFSVNQTCSGDLAPGASCLIFFAFEPNQAGPFMITSTLNTNAGPVSVQLVGSAYQAYYFPTISK